VDQFSPVVDSVAVSSGIAWSIGYWNYFHINPFHFADISVISSSAVTGILPTLITFIFGAALIFWYTKSPVFECAEKLESTNEKHNLLSRKMAEGDEIRKNYLRDLNSQLRKTTTEEGRAPILKLISEITKRLNSQKDQELLENLESERVNVEDRLRRLLMRFSRLFGANALILFLITLLVYHFEYSIVLVISATASFLMLACAIVSRAHIIIKGQQSTRVLLAGAPLIFGILLTSFFIGQHHAKNAILPTSAFIVKSKSLPPTILIGKLGDYIFLYDPCTSSISLHERNVHKTLYIGDRSSILCNSIN